MRFPPVTAVATPTLVGVIVWWGVMLAGPFVLLRRLRRRRPAGELHRASRRPGVRHWDFAPLSPAAGLQAAAVALASSAGASAKSGAPSVRLPAGTLDPLCRGVDFHRRLELAEREVRRRLSVLPADRWRVEPYPLTGGRRNTLVVLGETGVFVISATFAPGHWDDIVTVSRLASKIGLLLPGYDGQVRSVVCHPFSSVEPRRWHRPDEHGEWVGAWLVGGDSLIAWLEHFGDEHGLGPGDLRRFDELSEPNWLRPAIAVPPSWPPLPDSSRSFPKEC